MKLVKVTWLSTKSKAGTLEVGDVNALCEVNRIITIGIEVPSPSKDSIVISQSLGRVNYYDTICIPRKIITDLAVLKEK